MSTKNNKPKNEKNQYHHLNRDQRAQIEILINETNEKHNDMIRYFIPKDVFIENYSNKDIEKIANWMNNYPRKIFGYKTPTEMLKEELNNDELFDKIINIQKELNVV